MTKYHITQDGPKICKATIKNCKYGEHYINKELALKSYHEELQKTEETLKTIKKIHILHPEDNLEQETYGKLNIQHGVNVNAIGDNKVIFPRNRAIPFGEFLESEINNSGSTLINTYEEHSFVSDSTRWRGDLRHGIKYWGEDEIDNLSDGDGPFFVKGETNALKNEWDKYCYAEDKNKLIEVVENNKNHPLLQNQKIIIQPFLKFKKLGVNDNNGQPVINEWRYFCLNSKVMAGGFYWSQQNINE